MFYMDTCCSSGMVKKEIQANITVSATDVLTVGKVLGDKSLEMI